MPPKRPIQLYFPEPVVSKTSVTDPGQQRSYRMPQLNRFIRRYLLTLMLLSFLVLGQSVDNPPVPDEETPSYQLHALLLKLRGSNYDPLISARATPTLREAFNNATGALTKENIASVLMIIGQKDEIYWSPWQSERKRL